MKYYKGKGPVEAENAETAIYNEFEFLLRSKDFNRVNHILSQLLKAHIKVIQGGEDT